MRRSVRASGPSSERSVRPRAAKHPLTRLFSYTRSALLGTTERVSARTAAVIPVHGMRTVATLIAACLLVSCAGPADTEKPAFEAPLEPISIANISPGGILDFFSEVAIGSEYGESSDTLCKWTHRIRYFLKGEATDADRELISRICERLNAIEGFPGIYETASEVLADLTVSFVTHDELMSAATEASENCTGFASYEWDEETGEIIRASALIDSTLTAERACTLCEEFLQSLGPARDSYLFPNSVFYQGYTLTPFPTELDFAVLEMLYSPRLEAGMSRAEAISHAAGLLKWE